MCFVSICGLIRPLRSRNKRKCLHAAFAGMLGVGMAGAGGRREAGESGSTSERCVSGCLSCRCGSGHEHVKSHGLHFCSHCSIEQHCSSKYSELSSSLLGHVQLSVTLALLLQRTLDLGLKLTVSIGKKCESVLDGELECGYTWCQHVCRFLQNADIHLIHLASLLLNWLRVYLLIVTQNH